MANYYAPFYRPNYYGTYQDPMQYGQQMQTAQQMQPVQPQPQLQMTQPQNNSGLIWVQGEAGAKSYLVAPGNTVMLMDSEGERFYLKSADASGMPMPLRVFEYKERTDAAPAQATQEMNLSNYVTHEELEQRLAAIPKHVCTCHTKKQEDVTDGEPLV